MEKSIGFCVSYSLSLKKESESDHNRKVHPLMKPAAVRDWATVALKDLASRKISRTSITERASSLSTFITELGETYGYKMKRSRVSHTYTAFLCNLARFYRCL